MAEESTTLDTLVQEILKDFRPGPPHPLQTTTGAGTSSSLVIGKLGYSSWSANAFDGWYIYCPSVTTGIKESQVTRGGNSSGTLTMSPAYGSSPGTGVSAYLLGPQVTIADILDAINNVITTTQLPRYGILSQTPDPNMEGSDASSYTALNGSTLGKATTAANILTGRQSLSVVTDAADEGVTTEDISAASVGSSAWRSGTINVVVAVQPTVSTTLNIILYDVTNSSAIRTVTTPTAGTTQWFEARFTESVPSTCEEVSVRVTTNSSGSDTWYVDHVSLMHSEQPYVPIPDEIISTQDIDGLMRLPQGMNTPTSDVFIPFGGSFRDIPYEALRDTTAAWDGRIDVMGRQRHYDSIWVRYRAAEAAIAQNTSDTNTTKVPQRLILAGALADLHKKAFDRQMGTDRETALHAARASYWSREYMALRGEDAKPRSMDRTQHRIAVR